MCRATFSSPTSVKASLQAALYRARQARIRRKKAQEVAAEEEEEPEPSGFRSAGEDMDMSDDMVL